MKPLKLLKGKRFEQKPKRVVQAPDFHDYCGVKHHARLMTEFHELLDCIHNGWPISDEFYQRQIDLQGDRLLQQLGVKHLHLGGQGSDVIVYMAEFEDWVELIEINTHVHLESEPRGRDLKGAFRVAGAAAAGAVVGTAVAGATSSKRRRRRPRKRKPVTPSKG